MAHRLSEVIASIRASRPPAVILVGGSSDYLAEQAANDIRSAFVESIPGISVDVFEAGTDLGTVLDSFRTHSLFGGKRLLVVQDVNAFVSAKEVASLFEKAQGDWRTAKTDRKRSSAAAKLLHVLGLVGADLEMADRAIASALGVSSSDELTSMLAFARSSGKRAGRGEGDAALLMEAIARGGAPGTHLLLRTGEVPRDSATIDLLEKHGVVVSADLTREGFAAALDQIVEELSAENGVRFDKQALARLRAKLGIDRILADKFSKDIPDLRSAVSEAERLITLAGSGGRVTPDVIDREVATVEGGARYELASLFSEGKAVEAVAKLRDLTAQARREDPKTSADIHYGRFLFPLADELRQIIAIFSFARSRKIDRSRSMQYNRFKDTVAEPLGDYMKSLGLVRQRPHPFPLHKKWEATRASSEAEAWRALAALADIDLMRKSGGLPIEVALETFLLQSVPKPR